MKPSHHHILAFAAVAAVLALVPTKVSAATIVSDTFTDGGITDGTDAQDVAWTANFNVNTPTVVSASPVPGTGNAMNVDATSTSGSVRGALPSDTALNLTTVGQTITLSMNVLYTGTPDNTTGFRFGLMDSGLDIGVGVVVGTGTGTGYSIRHDINDTNTAGDRLGGVNGAAAFSGTGDTSVANTVFGGMVINTSYALSFSMTLTSLTQITYSASVNGGLAATAVDVDNTPDTNNNEGNDFLKNFSGGLIIVRNGTGTTTDFRVDDVLVTSVVPEPSAPLMLISSLGTLALLRRRR